MFTEKSFISRLAPSPTGYLHLGNIWSFMCCWLAVRASGGKIYLRMDDIDIHRSKKVYANQIVDDLLWLGFDWNDAPTGIGGIYVQSDKVDLYHEYATQLVEMHVAYPCFCSRRELRMIASAPHAEDGVDATVCGCRAYSPEIAAAMIKSGRQYALRMASPVENVEFTDLLYGRQIYSRHEYGGDFAIIRGDGVPSYQLATVADDASLGVNLVVRARDLLPSTPRQLVLLRYLGLPVPQYAHVPMLLDSKGERLAKRHTSLSIKQLREDGVNPQHIFGLLAFLGGMRPAAKPVSLAELIADFRLEKISPADIFAFADDQHRPCFPQ